MPTTDSEKKEKERESMTMHKPTNINKHPVSPLLNKDLFVIW
jgi:hypothetical protein